MQITGGKYKGRKISISKYKNIRPTSSKVRESIFSMLLGSIEDASFLDMFGGSAIMGIEAISRGAKKLTVIEKNRKNAFLTKQNLELFDFEYSFYVADSLKMLDKMDSQAFDIIFADPPYKAGLYQEILKKVKESNLLRNDGILILEYDSDDNIEKLALEQDYCVLKSKKYGDTCIIFCQPK